MYRKTLRHRKSFMLITPTFIHQHIYFVGIEPTTGQDHYRCAIWLPRKLIVYLFWSTCFGLYSVVSLKF